MCMLRTCEEGVRGRWHYLFLGGRWVDLIGGVRIGMPNCLCMPFFNVRPGVLSKTLSHV